MMRRRLRTASKPKRGIGFALFGAVLLMLPVGALAEKSTLDVVTSPSFSFLDFMQETQRQSPNPEVIDLVWWLPVEFWQSSMAQEGVATRDDLEELAKIFAPYVVVAVSFGDIGPFGGVTWRELDELRENIRLHDSAGNEYVPMSPLVVNPDARNLVAMMQPTFAAVTGPVGENMSFFFFPSRGKLPEPIGRADQEGSFTIRLFKENYEWRLPIGSVLPPKRCPVDDEQMPGNWNFCPWHGDKLETLD